MPIYEFYCRSCHTIYSFFARRADTESIPACPKHSSHKLQRQMSRFAISSGRSESATADDAASSSMDDEKMERMMMQLSSEAENMNEEDPRAMARLLRRFADAGGMNVGQGMEEMIRRMEAGEDPDRVEEELGDVLDSEDPFGMESGDDQAAGATSSTGRARLKSWKRRLTAAPRVDPELYDM